MKKNILTILIAGLSLLACNTNNGGIDTLDISENGITCESVFLTEGEDKVNTSEFTYGKTFEINFNDISGFNKEDGRVFPGLELVITSVKGDTVLYSEDLYAESKGYDLPKLLLQAKITAAKPIISNVDYSVKAHIWDKKGDATYTAKMKFDVKPNENIKVESSNVTYNDIYLFSDDRSETIFNEQAYTKEKVYLIFDGLKGFSSKNGKATIGIKVTATDDKGNLVVNEEDLMKDKQISLKEIESQIAPYYTFKDGELNNPILCETLIWDKNSDHKIKASAYISFLKKE